MYDRFFKALDEQGVATPLSNHQNLAKNTSSQFGTPQQMSRCQSGKDLLESTSGSWFGNHAVEDMRVQLQEQVQARVDELEHKLAERTEQLDRLSQEHQKCALFIANSNQSKIASREKDLEQKVINLEKSLEQKHFDYEKLQRDFKEKEQDLQALTETFQHEYEVLRKQNEHNVKELQRIYKENITKSRSLPRPVSMLGSTASYHDGDSDLNQSSPKTSEVAFSAQRPPIY